MSTSGLPAANAGIVHALARLGGTDRVCIVAESPGEALTTVAGLVRAADLGRDRFLILVPRALTEALAEVLAHAGIGLPGAVEAGQITIVGGDPGPSAPAEVVARLRSGSVARPGPGGRCFAVVDCSAFVDGRRRHGALELLIALGEAAADLGLTAFSLFDRSLVAPALVHDAISCHRLVLSQGVLGENLHYTPAEALLAHRETPLDVDQLLHSLGQAVPPGEAPGLDADEAASARLREAGELLQREIAERVRMEHVLSASEERYRLLVEALPDCVLVHSGGKIVFVNRAGVEMVRGASAEDVLGRSVMGFVHPESQATVAARVRMMSERGLRAPLMTERFLRLDGTDFYAEAIATPLVYDGRPGIQVVMRDITERSRAEAELRFKSFLADSAIDGILVRRIADRELLYVNPAMCAMSGLSREALVGSRERTFIAAREQAAVDRHVEAIHEAGQGIFETVMAAADGIEFPVEIHSAVVAHGEQQVIVSVIRDISERRRGEARQRQLAEQLQRAQKLEAIGTLASGIAHDFNNILTGILGYADLIRNQSREGEPFRRAADVIVQAGERGAALARKVLMVARKEKVDRQRVDLNALVHGAVELMRTGLPGNIELVLRLGERLPPLMADPSQIDQIVMNLASNACDAMPDGGRLTVETFAAGAEASPPAGGAQAPAGSVCLSVSDTGTGMDPETQQRVYDPFFTTKRQGRGTGLGLYVVHTAVSNHGGQITLWSESGRGTRICVHLPVAAVEPAAGAAAEVDPRGAGTVLVIDDERIVRDLCQDLLSSLGYTVLTADGGEEGLRVFRGAAERIDLVLLDMVMPSMSGEEVLAQLRRVRADARVILCSGYAPGGNDGIERLIAAGAHGFLPKPFTLQAIGREIKAALAGSAGCDERGLR